MNQPTPQKNKNIQQTSSSQKGWVQKKLSLMKSGILHPSLFQLINPNAQCFCPSKVFPTTHNRIFIKLILKNIYIFRAFTTENDGDIYRPSAATMKTVAKHYMMQQIWGDWPTWYYTKKIIAQLPETIFQEHPYLSLIPEQGPFHVCLNINEDVIKSHHSFCKALWGGFRQWLPT